MPWRAVWAWETTPLSAMPDDRLGERICAFAVPLPGYENLTLEDVLAYLKEKKVPKRFWPERLELIDRIPHTGSGKVKKYLLREELERRNTKAAGLANAESGASGEAHRESG